MTWRVTCLPGFDEQHQLMSKQQRANSCHCTCDVPLTRYVSLQRYRGSHTVFNDDIRKPVAFKTSLPCAILKCLHDCLDVLHPGPLSNHLFRPFSTDPPLQGQKTLCMVMRLLALQHATFESRAELVGALQRVQQRQPWPGCTGLSGCLARK